MMRFFMEGLMRAERHEPATIQVPEPVVRFTFGGQLRDPARVFD